MSVPGLPRALEPGPVPPVWQVILLEGVAFSLPAARGAWLGYQVLASLAGVAAGLAKNPRLQGLRVLLAVVAAGAVRHPVLAGLQLAVAAAWWIGRRHGAPAAAAVLLGLAAPFSGPWGPPAPVPGTFDVVTWNVARFRPRGWEYMLISRFRAVPLDLVVLQEPGYEEVRSGYEAWRSVLEEDRAGVLRLSAALGLPHVWSDAPLGYRHAPHQSGLVVLSRYPLRALASTYPRGPEDPPPAFRIDHPDGPLVVQPFHLWSPPTLSLAARRDALRALLERLPGDTPRLVMGDTNLIPLDRHDLLRGTDFLDAGHRTRGYGGTWPNHFPVARLDAIYVAGLTVVDAATFETRSSDHRPMWARLRR
jgi:endonuclease/exonuclease/phosphatase family metal-dependent hydrolase